MIELRLHCESAVLAKRPNVIDESWIDIDFTCTTAWPAGRVAHCWKASLHTIGPTNFGFRGAGGGGCSDLGERYGPSGAPPT